ncbi:hypothetical protein BDC45DRAFT_523342, partial [Circinella umbellata]
MTLMLCAVKPESRRQQVVCQVYFPHHLLRILVTKLILRTPLILPKNHVKIHISFFQHSFPSPLIHFIFTHPIHST